jgi:hypothetical protein
MVYTSISFLAMTIALWLLPSLAVDITGYSGPNCSGRQTSQCTNHPQYDCCAFTSLLPVSRTDDGKTRSVKFQYINPCCVINWHRAGIPSRSAGNTSPTVEDHCGVIRDRNAFGQYTSEYCFTLQGWESPDTDDGASW